MVQNTVLIVEDEKIIAEDLKFILQKSGLITVDMVSTGHESIAAVRKYSPDIILMDIILEGEMDGIDAARQISSFSDIPVIFITSNFSQECANNAMEENPYGYIIKPFRESDIKYAVMLGLQKSFMKRELNKKLKELENLKEILNDIIQTAPIGIILTDSDGMIKLANMTFQNLSGFSQADLRDNPISSFINSSTDGLLNSAVKTGSGTQIPVEIEFNKKDSDTFVSKTMIFYYDKPVLSNYKYLYYISDITFQKKLEIKQVKLQNYIENFITEMDSLNEMFLETSVYNVSIKRGSPDFNSDERRIIRHIESGLTNHEIAVRMKLAEITVKKRLSRIYSKLGIKNKYQLLEYIHTTYIPDK